MSEPQMCILWYYVYQRTFILHGSKSSPAGYARIFGILNSVALPGSNQLAPNDSRCRGSTPALRQNDFPDGPGLEKDLDVPFGGLRLGVNYFYGVYRPT